MRSPAKIFGLVLFVLLSALSAADAGPLSPNLTAAEAERILAQANAEMEKAAVARTLAESQGPIRSAIEHYLRLESAGYRSGYLYYNLGNCYLRLREIGEAIYWYRVAERLIPQDAQNRANLRYARSLVRVKFPPPPVSEVLRTVFFFHYLVPLDTRINLFLLFWSMFWIVLGIALFVRFLRRVWLWVLIAGALAVFGVSAGLDIYSDRIQQEGVIVQGDVVVRKGAGLTYDPVLTEPLSPGVEVEILQNKQPYAEIRFTNGMSGWIPSTALRPIVIDPSF